MTRWIHRDPSDPTRVMGHFANRQPGYAEEEVPNDHPDVLAWRTRRQQARADARQASLNTRVPDLAARVATLEAEVVELKRKTALMP